MTERTDTREAGMSEEPKLGSITQPMIIPKETNEMRALRKDADTPETVDLLLREMPQEPGEWSSVEWIDYSRKLRTAHAALREENERLRERLNHAVTELSRAALSEDFDSEDCLTCLEKINDEFAKMGHTTDWHTLNAWYDKLCASCGIDNGDEINILPIAVERLQRADALQADLDAAMEAVRDADAALVWISKNPSADHVNAQITFFNGKHAAIISKSRRT